MSETVVAALVGAVGVVLAALIARSDRRADTRYEDLAKQLGDVEKGQGALGAAIERLERRMEDGLARLADRIDRLYGSAPAGPAPTTTSEDLERFKRFITERGAAGPTTSTTEAGDEFMEKIRHLAVHGEIPPDPGPRGREISAAELNAQLEALRQAIETYSEQRQEGTQPPGAVDRPSRSVGDFGTTTSVAPEDVAPGLVPLARLVERLERRAATGEDAEPSESELETLVRILRDEVPGPWSEEELNVYLDALRLAVQVEQQQQEEEGIPPSTEERHES